MPLLPVLIVAAGICTYWNSLGNPFIWDDYTAITTNRTIQHPHSLWELLSPPRDTPVAGRPLVNLSFAINYALGGLQPTGYHVVNVAIHVACALLLFGIVRRTLVRMEARAASPDRSPPGRFAAADTTAFITALLWMVHPLQSEAVDYLTQRSESLMALLFLLTLYCAIRARESAGTYAWQVLAVLACASGMFAKESMVVAPLVVLLYDWAFEFDCLRSALRARAWLYTGLASTWIILAAVLWSVPRTTVGASTSVGAWTYLLNQVEVVGRYLRLSFWPSDLVLDYGLPRPLALRDVLPGALLTVGVFGAGGVVLLRSRRVGFLVAAFFLTLAPTSSVIPVTSEVGAERRMYLPFMALAVLAVVAGRARARAWLQRANSPSAAPPRGAPPRVGGRRASSSTRTASRRKPPQYAWIAPATLTVIVLLGLSARTIARNSEYRDPVMLWRADVERRPHGRSRMALAGALNAAGQHDQALALCRQAAIDFPDARFPLGAQLILQQRQFEEGIAVLQQFLADGPPPRKRRAAHTLLAQAFRAEGKLDAAADELRAILKDTPDDAAASAALAQLLSGQAPATAQPAGNMQGVLAE